MCYGCEILKIRADVSNKVVVKYRYDLEKVSTITDIINRVEFSHDNCAEYKSFSRRRTSCEEEIKSTNNTAAGTENTSNVRSDRGDDNKLVVAVTAAAKYGEDITHFYAFSAVFSDHDKQAIVKVLNNSPTFILLAWCSDYNNTVLRYGLRDVH